MNNLLPFVIIGLTSGSVYGLAGMGLVLTYKTSGVFNFAHGTVAAAMAYAFYDLHVNAGLAWPLALAIILFLLAPVVGIIFERMGRQLTEASATMKVVATVGLVVAVQQLTVIRYGAAAVRTPSFLPTGTVAFGGVNVGIDQLVVMGVALASMVGLTYLFRSSRLGRGMRAVVDNGELLSLTGASPTAVRRSAWYIGTAFAALSGVLLAPTIGLDATILTLLVVQAFGAAAIGLFRSIPATYAGGLAIGVVAALSTKYVASVPALAGLPSSLPFIVLFAILLVVPRRWLVDVASERQRRVRERRPTSRVALASRALTVVVLSIAVPGLAGTRLSIYTAALAYVILFLSLALLVRTSGQVSLAQLAFAAVGAAASARLAVEANVPWILAVLLGGLVAVPVGALVAIPAVRRSGLYLALATFGFGVLLERMVFGTSLMFGGGLGSLPAPRPSFARSEKAYFYVVLGFVIACVLLVLAVQRSRLGRLLRAMADSPLALSTYGTNVTVIKVAVFCISAFLAGLSGALLAPINGTASAGGFGAFASLLLLVVLSIAPGREVTAAFGAATALIVLPSYLTNSTLNEYLPVAFGLCAVIVATLDGGTWIPAGLARAAARTRPRSNRSPTKARLVAHSQPAHVAT